MADPHGDILTLLKELSEEKKTAASEGIGFSFFWDAAGKGKDLNKVFKDGEWKRDDLYDELVSLSKQGFTLADWLPPKVKLAFLSAFERDMRARERGRQSNYRRSMSPREENREYICEKLIEALTDIE